MFIIGLSTTVVCVITLLVLLLVSDVDKLDVLKNDQSWNQALHDD